MLFSIAMIIMVGLCFGWLCKLCKIPSLFGMILGGILIGPYCANWLDSSILSISSDLRRIALIIILIRAGLKLNLEDLKKVGRPAILMCFLPACVEMIGMILLAPRILGMNVLDAAILGAVIGAVSPAVVVPRMIRLIDEGYGTKQGIPQMILAGASVDDVFVIVMFTAFTGLAQGQEVSVMSFVNIPISILLGIFVGFFMGYGVWKYFSKIKMSNLVMAILFLSISFLLSTVETKFPRIPLASLIAIMAMGVAVKRMDSTMAKNLSSQFDKMWSVAEIFLFVLVGASVAIDHAKEAGLRAIILVLLVLVFRMLGVFFCVLGTKLSFKERLFCMIAYTPKATVQAAIGGLPLAMGLPCGEVVLTVSVVAILLTAPLGAFGIDGTYKKWLVSEKEEV
ncbi:MAG: cation:proton antiporter [Lachnospiraceae bacterium]|nr:cation:proton antiporter [Lachnospiraceae bacterium]